MQSFLVMKCTQFPVFNYDNVCGHLLHSVMKHLITTTCMFNDPYKDHSHGGMAWQFNLPEM